MADTDLRLGDEHFDGITVPRTIFQYEDGVKVEILNLSSEATEDKYQNGKRIFHRDGKPICKFPGYSIEKYIAATHFKATTEAETEESVQKILAHNSKSQGKADSGIFILTNDGPLILVFKIEGKVRVNMMRSANHGFDLQFEESFKSECGDGFDALFPDDCVTSELCFLFRDGRRCSSMEMIHDEDGHSLLFMGTITCEVSNTDGAKDQPRMNGRVVPKSSSLDLNTVVGILRDRNYGLVCFRHEHGETQIISEQYLNRVAVMTGVSHDQLITGKQFDEKIVNFSNRALELQANGFAKLHCSRFPRLLDLLSLFVLCGVIPGKKNPTVCGFSTKIEQTEANISPTIIASPLRGFYNFCRAANINPRKELKYPATPGAIRFVIKKTLTKYALPSKSVEIREQFQKFEYVMLNTIPQLILRVLYKDPHGIGQLAVAFETAFGLNPVKLLSGLPNWRKHDRSVFRSMVSAVLCADQRPLVTIMRFCLKHLDGLSVQIRDLTNEELSAKLGEFSNSSRRRRQIAEKVLSSYETQNPEDDADAEVWVPVEDE